jgi:hypothetical protein
MTMVEAMFILLQQAPERLATLFTSSHPTLLLPSLGSQHADRPGSLRVNPKFVLANWITSATNLVVPVAVTRITAGIVPRK